MPKKVILFFVMLCGTLTGAILLRWFLKEMKVL